MDSVVPVVPNSLCCIGVWTLHHDAVRVWASFPACIFVIFPSPTLHFALPSLTAFAAIKIIREVRQLFLLCRNFLSGVSPWTPIYPRPSPFLPPPPNFPSSCPVATHPSDPLSPLSSFGQLTDSSCPALICLNVSRFWPIPVVTSGASSSAPHCQPLWSFVHFLF